MSLGIHSFKIEGRMKGALYLATVVRTYRQAIERYWENPDAFHDREPWMRDLDCVSHRPYTSRFLFPDQGNSESQEVGSSSPHQSHTLAGIVRPLPETSAVPDTAAPTLEKHWVCMEVRSRLFPGSKVDFLFPNGTTVEHVLDRFEDLNGRERTVAHPNDWIRFPASFLTFPFQVVRCSQEQTKSAKVR
jgi:U32 family peptidase